MRLTVIRRGLFLAEGEVPVGQIIEVKGDSIPKLYLGKVRPSDQQLEIATPRRKPKE